LGIAGHAAGVARWVGEHYFDDQRFFVGWHSIKIGIAQRRVDGVGNGKPGIGDRDGNRSHGDDEIRATGAAGPNLVPRAGPAAIEISGGRIHRRLIAGTRSRGRAIEDAQPANSTATRLPAGNEEKTEDYEESEKKGFHECGSTQ